MSSTSDTGRPPPPDARAIIAYAYELEQHAIRTLARAGELRALAGLMQEDDENQPVDDDPSPWCRCETCPAHGPFPCIGGDND